MTSCLYAQTASAAELVWIGGAGSSWHTPENWAPIDGPGGEPIQRIPEDGDTVVIADTTHGPLVRLNGDSPRLAGLEIANGFELASNGHFLHVEDGGEGKTIIRGDGSRVALVRGSAEGNLLQTDLLEVIDSGALDLFDDRQFSGGEDGTVQVLHGAAIAATSQLAGHGTILFGDESIPVDTVLLSNEGTIRPTSGGLTNDQEWRLNLITRGGGLVDLDGSSNNGIIDVDEPGRVVFDAGRAHSRSFRGTLRIGGSDVAYSLEEMQAVKIEFNARRGEAGVLIDVDKDMRLSGLSEIHVRSGRGDIVVHSYPPEEPGFRMTGGSIRVDEHAALTLGGTDGHAQIEFHDVAVYLEDNSELSLSGTTTFDTAEIHLVGESKTATLSVEIFSGVTINSDSLDPNRSSPGFDGDIRMNGGSLTVNVPGGWKLDGRLVLDNTRDNEINGSTIIVDGGDPGDGIYSGGDYPATINSDLVLTENARIDLIFGDIYLQGNVTSFRSELGSGDGGSMVFSGDVTTFAVPTMLNVAASFQGGTVVLDADLMIPSGIGVFFDEDVEVLGDGRVLYEERGHFVRGDFNGNGLVEQADLDLVLSHWGAPAATAPEGWGIDPPSGTIDQDELDRVLSGWGSLAILPEGAGAATAVPEPVSALLAVMVIGAALLHMARSPIQYRRNITSRPPASFRAGGRSLRGGCGA